MSYGSWVMFTHFIPTHALFFLTTRVLSFTPTPPSFLHLPSSIRHLFLIFLPFQRSPWPMGASSNQLVHVLMTAAVAWRGFLAFKGVLLPTKNLRMRCLPFIRPGEGWMQACICSSISRLLFTSIWSASEPAGHMSRISLIGQRRNGQLAWTFKIKNY